MEEMDAQMDEYREGWMDGWNGRNKQNGWNECRDGWIDGWYDQKCKMNI